VGPFPEQRVVIRGLIQIFQQASRPFSYGNPPLVTIRQQRKNCDSYKTSQGKRKQGLENFKQNDELAIHDCKMPLPKVCFVTGVSFSAKNHFPKWSVLASELPMEMKLQIVLTGFP